MNFLCLNKTICISENCRTLFYCGDICISVFCKITFPIYFDQTKPNQKLPTKGTRIVRHSRMVRPTVHRTVSQGKKQFYKLMALQWIYHENATCKASSNGFVFGRIRKLASLGLCFASTSMRSLYILFIATCTSFLKAVSVYHIHRYEFSYFILYCFVSCSVFRSLQYIVYLFFSFTVHALRLAFGTCGPV